MDPSCLILDDPQTCRPDPAARTASYFARRGLCRVDVALLEQLHAERRRRGGGNVRLSLHTGPEDTLHEMLILQESGGFFPPKKHPHKAKSFTILEGELLVCAFDEGGEVLDLCILDGRSALAYRVEAGLYHCDLPLTATAIHLEATLGPFRGEGDRILAPWAPAVGDRTGLAALRRRLLAATGRAGT